MKLFGIHLVGITSENGRKLLLTIGFIAGVWLLSVIASGIARRMVRGRTGKRVEFWTHQVIQIGDRRDYRFLIDLV